VVRNWITRWLTEPVLTVAVLAGCVCTSCAYARDPQPPPGSVPRAQAPQPTDTLRQTFNNPGESKPIIIDSDEIVTWVENGQRVVLLRGQVLVQQNVVQTRIKQGVAWIDVDYYKRTGIQHLQLYGEAGSVDNGSEVKNADRMVLDLYTRGELKLNAHAKQVVQQSQSSDPLVKRGQAECNPPAPAKPQSGAPPEKENAPPPAAPEPGAPKPPTAPVLPPYRPGGLQQASYQETAPAVLQPKDETQGRTVQGPPPPPPPPVAQPIAPPAAAPPGLPPATPPLPAGGRNPVVIASPTRTFSVLPRYGSSFGNIQKLPSQPGDGGLDTYIISGGILLIIRNTATLDTLDVEADRLVIWTKGVTPEQLVNPNGTPVDNDGGQRHLEFYLAGNVELRQQVGKDSHILRADELYYDTNRNVAIALKAQLEFKPPLVADPIMVNADELYQHAPQQYEVVHAEIFSSKLPSDPGLKVYVRQATIEDKTVPKFGTFRQRVIDHMTGEQVETKQTIFKGRDVYFELENVPFLYSPYLSGDARDPLGPIEDINFGYNRLYGFVFGTTLNAYDLLGIQPYENTKWRAQVDYLTARGPGFGTTFDYSPKEIFGIKTTSDCTITAYGIYDDGFDILPGRSWPQSIPEWRGRLKWRQAFYDLPDGFTVQSQLAYVSDRNYLEEYFLNEWYTDVPEATFAYVKQSPAHTNYAWTGLVESRLGRAWVTQQESLPRVDGWLIGQSFFDLLSYNAHGSAGYYQLHITSDVGTNGEKVVSPLTDVAAQTGRFDFMQELSLPFTAGPFKLVPYTNLDLASYTQDTQGQTLGRVWGGGGLRASIPFTRIFPDVQSELWNLDGINHKIVFSTNYFYAQANEPHTRFPQIDRLNDDETDQALRDFTPSLTTYYTSLLHSPAAGMFDPQMFAIQKLVMNRIDTLDSIDILQLDLRQRLQTKRGYPGAEHIVDWMTLDLGASYFPQAGRDNVGQHWAFVQYDYTWNIGDRTAISSSGWMDPYAHSARAWNIGTYLNRTDRTNFYLGFRYLDGYQDIDPINSRMLTAAVTYVFSQKYSLTAGTSYDFGTALALSNSLILTRMGSDLQISVGLTFNALTNSFGALVEVVPNLVPANRRVGPVTAAGPGQVGH
jgi:hypothetical protein